MSRPVIQVSGIRKTYGKTVAVDEVSFAVHDGEIFGLIGPNGAGKTTTMRIITGYMPATAGTVLIGTMGASFMDGLADEELRQIALWKMEGHTNEEIASELGCALATVERRLRLIRRRWEKELPAEQP